MGSLIKHAKKIKKACIGIATGVTVATMMIPPIVLSQMIMMDQEDKCSSEATGSIDVSSDGTVEENKKAIEEALIKAYPTYKGRDIIPMFLDHMFH